MRSTTEVLAHHLKCFAARDIDGIVSDYSADAVFFSVDGAVRGPDAIRAVFEKLFSEFGKTGVFITPKQRLIEGDYVYSVFTAETPDNSYELASDTFVIRNGSIELQAFTAKTRPKH
jgi:ketosteroid isomerase-like protein